jgi:hypothetical protein
MVMPTTISTMPTLIMIAMATISSRMISMTTNMKTSMMTTTITTTAATATITATKVKAGFPDGHKQMLPVRIHAGRDFKIVGEQIANMINCHRGC